MMIKDALGFCDELLPKPPMKYPTIYRTLRCIKNECQAQLLNGHKMDDQYMPSKAIRPAIKSQPKLRLFLYRGLPQKIPTNTNVNGINRILYWIRHHPYGYSYGDLLLARKLKKIVNCKKAKFVYHTEMQFYIPPASKIRIRKGHFCLEGTYEYESREPTEADKEGAVEVPLYEQYSRIPTLTSMV